jgi:hypothetical protein
LPALLAALTGLLGLLLAGLLLSALLPAATLLATLAWLLRLLAGLLLSTLLPALAALLTLARLLRLLARPLGRVLGILVHGSAPRTRLVQREERAAGRDGSRRFGIWMPLNVGNRSVRLAGAAAADLGTGLERVFEGRIPVAATVAAPDQQAERQDGKDEPRDPYHRTPAMADHTSICGRREAAMVRAQ